MVCGARCGGRGVGRQAGDSAIVYVLGGVLITYFML